MNFTLHQLEIFQKVAETLSITKTAEQLHLTQPAVSIQLKNFQNQFSYPLIEIIGKQVYLTDFGKEIAMQTQKVLEEMKIMQYKTSAFQGILSGKLKISVVSTGKYVIPFFLTDFLHQNTGVELELDVTNRDQVLQDLKENKVDFSLISILPDNLSLEYEILMKNRLHLVSNQAVKLDKKHDLNTYLTEVPLIFRELGSGTRSMIEKYLNTQNITVTRKMILTGNEAVKQALMAGFGCSIMPEIGIKNELKNGLLHLIPYRGLPLESNWYLVWNKGKKHNQVAKHYLDYIQQEKSKVIEKYFENI
jgi:DNA-binding transcriptional LysR family regulator